eukprot:TRINITY_DN84821_c0_g1_i1.p1 TRINITY_DN84821_c0_g1~~TRINITY_DN84821_c0_g1_i1.p1  ORF type:complete len:187 (+),score=29.86 TRINITY_DN84821_c0_g1_i1:61-621(+)
MDEHIIDYIYENQRRNMHLPAGDVAPTAVTEALKLNPDAQYNKKNLESGDPSPWVDEHGTTTTPATFPFKEGYELITPWIYVVDTPKTDSGGWLYKPSFGSTEESNTNTIKTMVRTRKWKRVSGTKEERERLKQQQIEEEIHEEQERRLSKAHDEEQQKILDELKKKEKWYPGKFIKEGIDKLKNK